MANVLIASGAVALAVVSMSWITFEIGHPPGALDGDPRLAPGVILAAMSGAAVLAGGLLVRSAAGRRT